MRADRFCIAVGFAAPVVASPATTASSTTKGLWQPLKSQEVLDLAVVYGPSVETSFSSWNPTTSDFNHIFHESTYSVLYVTPLPAAALYASISWSTIVNSFAATMVLQVPTSPGVTTCFNAMLPSTETFPTTTTPSLMSSPASTSISSSTSSLSSSPSSSPSSTSASLSISPTTSSSISSSTSSSTSISTLIAASSPSFTSASTSVPSPEPTGLIHGICDICFATEETKFTCRCSDKYVNGDLDKLLAYKSGAITPAPGGFAEFCDHPAISGPPDFMLYAFCTDGHKVSTPLGSHIQLVYDGELKFEWKDDIPVLHEA